MSDNCNIPHPLKREGTNQEERFPTALEPDYVKVDEKTLADLVKQAGEFSRLIKYYNETNPQNNDGFWNEFFEEIYDFNSKQVKFKDVAELNEKGNISPHLGLFLAFLQLYQYPQKEINNITNRHLNFYYHDILKIKELKEVADKVVVFFELDKNFTQQIIPKNTYLKAGKDATGKELFYKTIDELVVNRGKVAEIKTIFTQSTNGGITNIFAAPVANSSDGKGAVIRTVPASWPAFGSIAQPPAMIGFAIASPILNLKEGLRTIEINSSGIGKIPATSIVISYTTVKGWATCLTTQVSTTDPDKIVITLSVTDAPVTKYVEKVHQRNFPAAQPVLLVNIVTSGNTPYQADHFSQISLKLLKLNITVDKLKNVPLYNDFGVLDNSKPFLPFGNFPKKGANFFIGAPDIFNKYCKKFSLHNEAGDYILVYNSDQFRITFLPSDSSSKTKPVKLYFLQSGIWQLPVFRTFLFKFDVSFSNDYLPDQLLNSAATDGFVKIVLDTDDFSLDNYERQLLQYVSHIGSPLSSPPVKPISPYLENIYLRYESETFISLNPDKEHQFFKVYPFGYAEATNNSSTFIDDWSWYTASLFIGLRDMPQYASIALHIQMHEGTGDTDIAPVPVAWHCVSENTYLSLEKQIIRDTTNGFTQSGIIQFTLSFQAIHSNTILNPDLIWLRAAIAGDSAAFPKLISIMPQAAEAVFEDKANDPKHLAAPLAPAIVTKLVTKIDGIKSVTQPFPSYEGKMKENQNDRTYRTRISERLRHKQRTWTIWDYEHILLQQFSYLDKVKCISHSTTSTEFAPGHILIVALPIVSEINADDLYEPRLSTGRLVEIKAFLKKHHTPFVNINVINPAYEKLKVTCSVKFLPGDDLFNSNRLITDLKNYFAPWAQSGNKEVFFRSKIYVAEVINFIEERKYVDYITSLQLAKYTSETDFELCPEVAVGSSEHAILTSYNTHIITATQDC